MTRKGFTLTELLIAIALMSILFGTMTLSMKPTRQTAQREAERLAAKLVSLTRRADRENNGFVLKFDDENRAKSFSVEWDDGGHGNKDDSFTASTGCYFKPFKKGMYYNSSKFNTSTMLQTQKTQVLQRYVYINVSQDFSGKSYYDIEVFGADGKTSHVVITSGDKL